MQSLEGQHRHARLIARRHVLVVRSESERRVEILGHGPQMANGQAFPLVAPQRDGQLAYAVQGLPRVEGGEAGLDVAARSLGQHAADLHVAVHVHVHGAEAGAEKLDAETGGVVELPPDVAARGGEAELDGARGFDVEPAVGRGGAEADPAEVADEERVARRLAANRERDRGRGDILDREAVEAAG